MPRAFRCLMLLGLLLQVFILPSVAQTDSKIAEQVKAIQENPKFKTASDYLDDSRAEILREWIEITEINAPSGQEQPRAKHIESLLRQYKLHSVHYDSAGNLIAVRKGTGGGPVVVFDAHLDTVFQPGLKIKATVQDGRVYA